MLVGDLVSGQSPKIVGFYRSTQYKYNIDGHVCIIPQQKEQIYHSTKVFPVLSKYSNYYTVIDGLSLRAVPNSTKLHLSCCHSNFKTKSLVNIFKVSISAQRSGYTNIISTIPFLELDSSGGFVGLFPIGF